MHFFMIQISYGQERGVGKDTIDSDEKAVVQFTDYKSLTIVPLWNRHRLVADMA